MRKRKTSFDYSSLDGLRSLDELKAARNDLGDYGSGLAERRDAGEEIASEEVRKALDAMDELDERIADTELRLKSFRDKVVGGSASTEHHGDGEHMSYEDRDNGRYGTRESNPMRGSVLVRSDQSVAAWQRANGQVTEQAADLSFGRWLRGVVTQDWTGAEAERALTTQSANGGATIVPQAIWGQVIDLARNASVVLAAGGITIPMATQQLSLPRLEGDPGPAWRNESAAYVQNDLVLGAVQLKATSLGRILKLSVEILQDSSPSAIALVESAFAASLASEIDRVMLRGSGTSPEPRGILNTTGVTKIAHGANGAQFTNWDFALQAAGRVRAANYVPDGHITAPGIVTSASVFKDTNGNYLQLPGALLPVYPTNQVPSNLTVGTSTDTAEIYTGQWNQVALGVRQQISLTILNERFRDTGEIGVVADFRGDVAVLNPKAFTVDTGVRA